MKIYFEIYFCRNGGSAESPELAVLCGIGSLPGPFYSSGNQIHLTFISDESITRSGFEIFWLATGENLGNQFCIYTQVYIHEFKCIQHLVVIDSLHLMGLLDLLDGQPLMQIAKTVLGELLDPREHPLH